MSGLTAFGANFAYVKSVRHARINEEYDSRDENDVGDTTDNIYKTDDSRTPDISVNNPSEESNPRSSRERESGNEYISPYPALVDENDLLSVNTDAKF